MLVFVAGSSGVLGQSTIRQLCERGHEVVGLVRSDDKARLVAGLGATPVMGDIFDLEFLRSAAAGADVIMHLATHIPLKLRPTRGDWLENDRLRREATRNLIEVARTSALHAFVLQSIAFVYGNRRGEWVTEDTPPHPDRNMQSALDAERMALSAYDEFALPAVILRGATFYGPNAWHTRQLIDSVKRRFFPIIGSGEQYWHYIYVEDMASACVRAAEFPAPGEVFHVADDWPFHARDLLNWLAVQLNAAEPFRMTVPLARLVGGSTVELLTQSARFRTDKIKKMIGWTPRYPTYREGFAQILPPLGIQLK